jgi:ribonucleotide monophosphatase NagD (HAD superfamily)
MIYKKKITKNELVYEKLMGKPYLVTYEYAVSQIQRLNKKSSNINKFFIIG